MRRLFTAMLLCVSGGAWSEDCHVIIRQDALVKHTLDGREVYVTGVDDVKPGQCFKPMETAGHIKNLQKQIDDNILLAEAYKQTQETLQKLNEDYRQLIERHEHTLDKTVALSERFAGNARNYNQLARDYAQLTVKFDELAGKYRDVALTGGSPVTVELGAGLTDQGDGIGLLGAGLNIYKTWDIKAWGMIHRDFFGMLGGASFRF